MPFALLVVLLVFAPLFRGGNRPLPLLVLECVAIGALALLAWHGELRVLRRRTAIGVSLVLLLVAPLLQLVPIPASWWASLPGHAPYAQALAFAGPEAASGMRGATINARATEYAWLALLPPVAAFVWVLRMGRRQVHALVRVFVGVALLQAALGLAQVGAGSASWLCLDNRNCGGFPTGTYVNKNHFAALMAMALPMAVALWALRLRSIGDTPLHPRHSDRWFATQVLVGAVVVVLLAALVLTASRAGIGSGLLAASLASFTLVYRTPSLPARVAFAALAVGGVALAGYAGLTPVLERFAAEQVALGYEGRAAIAAAAVRAGLDFLPFGSGLGTFADVFRRYQVEGIGGFIDHAHNDYVELFVEMGIAGVAVAVLALVGYALRWVELLRHAPSRTLQLTQVAAGLGMMAMLVHAAFDFNFHIPANALYFGFLAGVFFLTPGEDRA